MSFQGGAQLTIAKKNLLSFLMFQHIGYIQDTGLEIPLESCFTFVSLYCEQ